MRGGVIDHGPCEYLYGDGERCVWNGELRDGMCVEHRAEVRAREHNRLAERRRAAARKKQRERGEGHALYDHSAPWRCRQDECETCADKPTFTEYVRGRTA